MFLGQLFKKNISRLIVFLSGNFAYMLSIKNIYFSNIKQIAAKVLEKREHKILKIFKWLMYLYLYF